jgi:hypothetical protein
MHAEFEVIDTANSRLWDFGWFDRTRFRLTGLGTHGGWQDALRAFIADPIAERRFCTQPDPWGASCGHHGPFKSGALQVEWFHRVPPGQLRVRLQAAVADSRFGPRPSADQMQPLLAWASEVERRWDIVAELIPPPNARRLDWADMVWWVFREFVSVANDGSVMSVAVIGYD